MEIEAKYEHYEWLFDIEKEYKKKELKNHNIEDLYNSDDDPYLFGIRNKEKKNPNKK